MNGPLDHFSNQQRERDSNSNINRDMVLLVVLVVMIQVFIQKKFKIITGKSFSEALILASTKIYMYNCAIHNRAESFFSTRIPSFFMFVVFEFSIQGTLGSLELESCDFENIFVTTLVNRDHVWPKIGFCNTSHH